MVTSAEVQEMEKKFDERIGKIEDLIEGLVLANQIQTTNLDTLTASTQGLVDITNAGKTLGKVIQWLSSFAVLGAFLYWLTLQAIGAL